VTHGRPTSHELMRRPSYMRDPVLRTRTMLGFSRSTLDVVEVW
jgi:hypothetical protein